MIEKLVTGLGIGVLGVTIFMAIALICGFLFMELWNFVAPVYWAAAPQVTFLQALATISLLAVIRPPTYTSKKK